MTGVLATRAAARLDLFANVAHDFVAEQDGRAERWGRVRPQTRVLWRSSIGRAALAAAASQVSTLTREPLPSPPDPLHLMATELAIEIDGGRSRAATRNGRRRHRQVTAWRVNTLWRPAIARGLSALQATTGEPIQVDGARLLLRLPSLVQGADALHVDEAPY